MQLKHRKRKLLATCIARASAETSQQASRVWLGNPTRVFYSTIIDTSVHVVTGRIGHTLSQMTSIIFRRGSIKYAGTHPIIPQRTFLMILPLQNEHATMLLPPRWTKQITPQTLYFVPTIHASDSAPHQSLNIQISLAHTSPELPQSS